MIVSCPSCSKRYMLDDALLPKEGRQVRCISCQHVWRQMPDVLTLMTPPSFLDLPTREANCENIRSPKKRSLLFGSVLFITIILVLVSISVFGRNTVVALWPGAERVYNLFGMQVSLPGSGLEISNATSLVHPEGSIEMIVVTGDLVNVSSQVRPIPPLKVKLMTTATQDSQNKDGTLDFWEHRLSESSLLPGEHIRFETAPRPKVDGTQYISVEF